MFVGLYFSTILDASLFIIMTLFSFVFLWNFLFDRYAICGDQTIKKIAKIRPSTRARLSNIDGVNQVFR